MATDARASLVVLTHNRRAQLMRTLDALQQLPGRWPVIVVDNGSTDGTAAAVAEHYPDVLLIRVRRNIGAAARNMGVAYAHTPYVAFCDDDTEWEEGSLERAVAILDSAPEVAVVNACVQVGTNRRLDPTCVAMANSPLERGQLPGPQLLGFMAGACVVRTRAFCDVGGYWAPFFIGGEEALVALDLVEAGWRIVYAEDVIVRHFPSHLRDAPLRKRMLIRNAVWVACMRLPWPSVAKETWRQLQLAHQSGNLLRSLMDIAVGLPRALRRRRVVSKRVEAMRRLLLPAEPEPLRRGADRHAT